MMNKTSTLTIFVTLTLIACLSVGAEPELKGSPEELAAYFASQGSQAAPVLLTLTGEASVDVQAEQAQVLLSVISEHERFKEALRLNQTIRTTAIATLTSGGIASERIRESALSSTPQYGFVGKRPKRYTVENLLHVVIASEQEFQVVAQIVDEIEQIFYRELTFTYPKGELNRQVMELAYAALAQKKARYENLFGVKLVLKSFTEGNIAENSPFTGLEFRDPKSYSRESFEQESWPVVTFGELRITGQLSATYTVHIAE